MTCMEKIARKGVKKAERAVREEGKKAESVARKGARKTEKQSLANGIMLVKNGKSRNSKANHRFESTQYIIDINDAPSD